MSLLYQCLNIGAAGGQGVVDAFPAFSAQEVINFELRLGAGRAQDDDVPRRCGEIEDVGGRQSGVGLLSGIQFAHGAELIVPNFPNRLSAE